MLAFAIDTENAIQAVEGRQPKDAIIFRTEKELWKATTEPIARLVEIWNRLGNPGQGDQDSGLIPITIPG